MSFSVGIINYPAAAQFWQFVWYPADEEQGGYDSGGKRLDYRCQITDVPEDVNASGSWLVRIYDVSTKTIEQFTGSLSAVPGGYYNCNCQTEQLEIPTEFTEFDIVPRAIAPGESVDAICTLMAHIRENEWQPYLGATIELVDYTSHKVVKTGKTNVQGYCGMNYKPDWIGTHEFYIVFSGSIGFSPTSTPSVDELIKLEVKEKVEPTPGEIKILSLSYA